MPTISASAATPSARHSACPAVTAQVLRRQPVLLGDVERELERAGRLNAERAVFPGLPLTLESIRSCVVCISSAVWESIHALSLRRCC